jgi:pimeloyl-ACP methyl ester carboxylesterase
MIPRANANYKKPDSPAVIDAWQQHLRSKITIPFEKQMVSTRFGPTLVLTAGERQNPAVLMINGMASPCALFRRQMVALAPQYRVITADIPGMLGGSALSSLHWVGKDYGLWALDLLNALHVETVHAVGVSMGATVLMKLAAAAPERMKSAFLMTPMGLVTSRPQLPVNFYLTLFRLIRAGLPEEVLSAFIHRWLVTPHPQENTIGIIEDLVRSITINSLHFQPRRRFLRLIVRFPKRQWANLTMPTALVLGGAEIFYDPRKAHARARRILPNLQRLEIVPHAGHGIYADHAVWVNTALLDFLASQSAHHHKQSSSIIA